MILKLQVREFIILTYSFTGLNGCQNDDSKVILVNEIPAVEAGPDLSICDASNSVQLSGNFPLDGNWSGIGVTDEGFLILLIPLELETTL